MLYKFKSAAAADLTMLQPSGEQVLRIIGKDPASKGIILPEQMPAAIVALEEAVRQESASLQAAADSARANGEPEPRAQGITLRQRTVPFIDMLRRCHKAGKEIVWGV